MNRDAREEREPAETQQKEGTGMSGDCVLLSGLTPGINVLAARGLVTIL